MHAEISTGLRYCRLMDHCDQFYCGTSQKEPFRRFGVVIDPRNIRPRLYTQIMRNAVLSKQFAVQGGMTP